MRRFVVLVVVLLMVGCGEDVGETAVTPLCRQQRIEK